MKKSELEDIVLNTKNLFEVDVRFYDAEKGIEREEPELIPKAIVCKVNDEYYNVIIGERLPLVRGSKVLLGSYIPFGAIENPELMDEKGICYVQTESNFIKELRKQEKISIRELEDRMLDSDIYFKDRICIVESRVNLSDKGIHGMKGRKLRRIAHKDWEKNCHFKQKQEQFYEGKRLQK